jgi:hypothetical protein
MTKQIFIFAHQTARSLAIEACKAAPDGYVCEIKAPTRNLEQNAKFHALCSDLAKSGIQWAGKERTAAQWKVLMVSGHAIATGEGAELIKGIEGEFVNIRESTALMSKKRGASLIEYVEAFLAQNRK